MGLASGEELRRGPAASTRKTKLRKGKSQLGKAQKRGGTGKAGFKDELQFCRSRSRSLGLAEEHPGGKKDGGR